MSAVFRHLQGLHAQLLIPLLLALILAQGISLLLFVGERRQAVRMALGGEIAGRIVNLVRLLEATPKDAEPAIMQSASSPFAKFSVDETALVDGRDERFERAMVAFIRAGLNEVDRPVRAVSETVPGHLAMRRPSGGMRHGMQDWHHRHHIGGDHTALRVSVALRDGRWLNARYNFHRPPLQAAWPSILATAFAAIGIVIVVIWAVRRISGPMRVLAKNADRLGRGDNPEAMTAKGPSEIRRVIKAFNVMQERVNRYLRERTQMLAALGHDLRSPLTAMRLRTELIDDDEARERLSASIDEMHTMVETTLSYAKGIGADEPTERTEIRGMANAIAEEIRLAGGSVDVEDGDAIMMPVRPVALMRALRNLVENAVKYGETARISFEVAATDTRILVDDDGPGLEDADLEKVFEPFFRLEASRNRETGGVGLGLAVARTVARAHGGDVTLTNLGHHGLRATLTLPR